MTIGIYALVFEGLDGVYIGKSVNIEKRFNEHLRCLHNGSSNHKLLEAFRVGGPPSLVIIEECSTSELEFLEETYISEFDAVENGLNILTNSSSPRLSGVESPNSKYSKETYCNIFKELVLGTSIKEISAKLNVSENVVARIRGGTTHTWLKEEYPEEYLILEKKIAESKHIKLDRFIRHKLSGEVLQVTNISETADKLGVRRDGLSRMITGGRKSYLGWSLV